MSMRTLVAALLVSLATAPAPAQDTLPGAGEDKGKTVVYRDRWGVPHIYAPNEAAGLYAMGWATAQDRPVQFLENLARALGESARFEGPGAVKADTVAHMFDHYGVGKRGFAELRPELQSHLEAYAKGANDYYAAHPEDVPEWWRHDAVDPAMIIAFGRLFLYGWSIDDGFSDLQRGGIEPGMERVQRGSNQWAIAPSRSAEGAAMLYIDPHLSWWGPSRFWEFRIHAGALQGSGFTLPASPYIGLGHNAHVAWAMTTGGPDTADVFFVEVNPENPRQYRYEGEWRDMTVRTVHIGVKGQADEEVTLYQTHYGPVVALRDGKAYSLRTSYADVANGNEAWYHLNFAKDYKGVVAALDTLTLFPQNVMAADVDGNIYYQRTGRIPKRVEGLDWSKPVDGSTAANDWMGYHASADHIQALNPEQGYMQNCNIPPDAMMMRSPLTPDRYPNYIFSDLGHGPLGGWTNQRGARAIELLHGDESVTIDECKAYALDVKTYGNERWQNLLQEAHGQSGAEYRDNADYMRGYEEILAWDGMETNESKAALKYFYWKDALRAELGQKAYETLRNKIDQFYLMTFGGYPPRYRVGFEVQAKVVKALADGMAKLKDEFGLDAAYGDCFRVGRDDESWPCAGGGDEMLGCRTLRSVSYTGPREDHTRWGRSGQTSTQVVLLTKPIQSWTQPPIGQSDRKDSPHYDDQAEKLFSAREFKPTWWMPEDLKDNIASREVLDKAPGD